MDSIVRSIQHVQDRTLCTEQRVDNIETRVELLEQRPIARESDDNSTQFERTAFEQLRYSVCDHITVK